MNKDDEILGFDPFEGDFGMPGDKVFKNKMVTARKEGPCAHCDATITPGQRVRSQQSKFDGELMSHRWCELCCHAMAVYDTELANDEELPSYELRGMKT